MSKLQRALNLLPIVVGKEAADLFLDHLAGGTSVPYLADWMERATGVSISHTVLKDERRRLRERIR